MKILVVVESPGKIDKLNKILNSQNDNNEYILVASCGHILSLNKEKTLGVDLENNYKPDYVPYPGKEHIIAKIRKIYKVCDAIWIASDMDQEGEFIGYSICSILKLDYTKIPRLLFDAIDKTTILNAIKNKTTLNQKILDAQQCRRIMDRLIGFKISAAAATVNQNLTVGRVQTIMVKLIIDREKEMKEFETSSQYTVFGNFVSAGSSSGSGNDDSGNDGSGNDEVIEAKLDTTFKTIEDTRKFMQDGISAHYTVQTVNSKISTKNPPEPLTTTTLQSLVSHRMNIPPKRVLAIAQNLYQRGVISYPRTDCPRLPTEKMKECETYITEQYGASYHKARVYASKDTADQEAHSCIYPTDITLRELTSVANHSTEHNSSIVANEDDNTVTSENDDHAMQSENDKPKYNGTWSEQDKRVYNYIWLYALSSQMAASKTEVTTVAIAMDNRAEKFVADYHKLVFPGYEKLWGKTEAFLNTDDDTVDTTKEKTKNLAILSLDSATSLLKINSLMGEQKLIKGPAPYTQADLIKRMKTLGVGRPSTLGEILADIMEKKFIIRTTPVGKKTHMNILTWTADNARDDNACTDQGMIKTENKEIMIGNYSNRLYSTELGRAINEFVDKFFPEVFNYNFTRDLQNDMDKIEVGEQAWVQVVDKLYKMFEPKLAQFPRYRTHKDGANPGWKPKRLLGKNGDGKDDDKNLYVFLAKYGQVIQIGEDNDADKKYVKLPLEFNLDTITLTQAQKIINTPIPLNLGHLSSGEEAIIKKGKYGLYVWTEKKNHKLTKDMFNEFDDSLPMEEQLTSLTLDSVEHAINKVDDGQMVGNIKIIKGKFGPYFVWKNKNINIPNNCNLTETELVNLAENKLINSRPTVKGKYKKK